MDNNKEMMEYNRWSDEEVWLVRDWDQEMWGLWEKDKEAAVKKMNEQECWDSILEAYEEQVEEWKIGKDMVYSIFSIQIERKGGAEKPCPFVCDEKMVETSKEYKERRSNGSSRERYNRERSSKVSKDKVQLRYAKHKVNMVKPVSQLTQVRVEDKGSSRSILHSVYK